MRRTVLMGVLLFAAPLFSEETFHSDDFHLDDTKGRIAKILGSPKMTGILSADLESWQYEIEEMDEGEFSHYFIFSRKSGTVQGITRNFNPPRNVDAMFPAAGTLVIELAPGYRARAREISDGEWLLTPGSIKSGERVSQLLTARRTVLERFYPAIKLSASSTWRSGAN